jgi:catechol 2,3-dioxygenase-like lactoylglutathione lyase family enzyme
MPVLQVLDVKAAEAFYCDKLGFASHGVWGDPPLFAIVQRGHVTLALDKSRDGSLPPRQQYWHAYIYVDDADALITELKALGVAIEREIEDTDYGCRDFDVRDPDGHIIGFGHVVRPDALGPGLDSGSLGRDAGLGTAAGLQAPTATDLDELTGGCQCGAVRFRAKGLGRASLCHCRMCQKAFGGVGGLLVTVHDAEWTRGAPSHFRSSDHVRRGFCRDCGTPLTFETAHGLDIAIAAFDRPDDIVPVIQLDRESRLPWFDALHRLPEPSAEERTRKADWFAGIVSRQHPDHDTDLQEPQP